MIPFGVVQSGAAGSPPAPITCAYPLDATEAEITGFGFTGRLSMDATEQIGTYTVQSGLSSSGTYGAGSAGISTGSADLIDFSTGKKAFKATFTRSAALTSANIQQTLLALTADMAERLSIERNASQLRIELNDVVVYSVATSATEDSVVIILDSATSTATAIVNGTEVVLSNNAFTPGSFQLFENTIEFSGLDAGLAGEELSVALITDAASMSEASGYGATDPCGNAI